MKGVESVMGGKVLKHEAKTIRNVGILLGRKEGRKEGREEGIRGTVSVLKELGVPQQTILSQIQKQYNLSLETSKKYL